MNEPDEPELHDAKLTALYREDAQQMPSPAADAAILAAARRAVGAGPQRRPLLLRQRWVAPLLAAATVAVIAIGIVRMIPPYEIASPAAERYRAPAPATAPAPAIPTARKPAPAPETTANAAAKAARHEDRPARLNQRQATRETGDSSMFVPLPPAAPEPPRSLAVAPSAANESAPAARYEAPAAAPAAATPPPALATAQSAPAAAAAGAMVARKSLGSALMPSQDATVTRYPVKWISAIRELRNAGRRDEAARELAEFKRRYPDYELPADLRDGK
jgi:resuscitation-promoting factor RpfA